MSSRRSFRRDNSRKHLQRSTSSTMRINHESQQDYLPEWEERKPIMVFTTPGEENVHENVEYADITLLFEQLQLRKAGNECFHYTQLDLFVSDKIHQIYRVSRILRHSPHVSHPLVFAFFDTHFNMDISPPKLRRNKIIPKYEKSLRCWIQLVPTSVNN